MEEIKSFVVTLVTTLIFITAVEMIGPDNSMKKYLKFILGLILIAIILAPIINFFGDGEESITQAITSFTENEDNLKSNEKTKEERKRIQEESFEKNLGNNILSLLKEEFDDTDFKVSVNCSVDFDNAKVDIEEIRLEVNDKSIKKIKKVKIGEEEKEGDNLTDKEKKVIKFLSKELKVDNSKIKIVKEG